MHDLVIRGGQMVTAAGIARCDVAVDGECITAIGPEAGAGAREIDATGLVVLPALIDVHVHFNEPGRADWEGAETGSRALAAGGGVLFIDMPLNSSPCTVNARAFREKQAALEAASITDFALWGGLVAGGVDALAELAECGVVGFKAFLCDSGLAEFPYVDDLTLYEGMQEAARLGLTVAVHAESDSITRGLSRRMVEQRRQDIAAFLESRPVIAETEAIRRAGVLAREAHCRLHIVHVSSGSGVAAAFEARALGTDISIETCPHYLFFTEEDLLRIGPVAKCAPPLRGAAEREALWSALLRNEVDIVGSDHSPCPPSLKEREGFFSVWGGIAGVQVTLPVMIDAGHHGRGLPLERVAELTATNGARRFGLRGKGSIAVGNDADFTLVDPAGVTRVAGEMLWQRHRISPYIGHTLRGEVKMTIRRGETIYSDGAITAQSRGRLVRHA